MSATPTRSTIAISKQGRNRLKALMPDESMTYEEFVMEMADDYENEYGRARYISGQEKYD